VRKRGLRRALSRHAAGTTLPVWRNERGFRLQLGDEVRAVMAAAQQYQPQSVAFPQDEPGDAPPLLEHVDEAAIRQHLRSSLPVGSLLDWLHTHHGHLQDATLLRLFHELQHEGSWQIEVSEHPETTTLQAIRVLHHPHRVSIPE